VVGSMKSPNGTSILGVRLTAVERGLGAMESQVNTIRDTMATKTDMAGIRVDMNSILSRIEEIVGQQAVSAKLNWPAISVGVVAIGMMATFAFWPINASIGDLKSSVIAISEHYVPAKQYEGDLALSRQTTATLRFDLTEVQRTYVQQQRIIRDEIELNELREKSMMRVDFEAQHRDLQSYVALLLKNQTDWMNEFSRRLERLEATHITPAK
jgi:hypothetical protein